MPSAEEAESLKTKLMRKYNSQVGWQEPRGAHSDELRLTTRTASGARRSTWLREGAVLLPAGSQQKGGGH